MKTDKYILETARTKIRPLSPDDAEHFYSLNQDPEVLKYTGDDPFETVNAAKEFLKQYDQYEKYGLGRWAVISKENGEFLGWCGLKYTPETNEYDLGYRFYKKYWNRGYATETSQAFIDYGLNTLKLDEIVGRAMAANAASVRVLQKIGMEFFKAFDFEGHPGVIYSIKRRA